MILITGATGSTGRELVRRLTTQGARVRALVRNPEKAGAKLGPGLELAAGDLEMPDTLDEAMKGVEKVFLLSPTDPRAVELQTNAIERARRAGVKHIVKMSAVESAPDSPVRFLRVHAQIEERLARSGVPYTNLRPHSFMQNTLGYASTIASEGKMYAPPGGAYPPVDVRDIAAVAAAVLTSSGHEGKTYTITGPEALTHAQVAEKIGRALGKEVKYQEIPPAIAREVMLGIGMSEWIVDGVLELFRLYDEGEASYVTAVIEEVARKKPITFDEFARDFAGAFAGQGVPSTP